MFRNMRRRIGFGDITTKDSCVLLQTGWLLKYHHTTETSVYVRVRLLDVRCPDSCIYDTVDGRNPAPVDMVNIPLFTGFYTSQVVQDFFHQQYVGFMFCFLQTKTSVIGGIENPI